MRYSIKKVNSSAKRYRTPRSLPAHLVSVGGTDKLDLTIALEGIGPEGGRLRLEFAEADFADPLLKLFAKRLYDLTHHLGYHPATGSYADVIPGS